MKIAARYSSDWPEISASLKRCADYHCQCCGVAGELHNVLGNQLSVHHINGNSLDNDSENLIVLCSRCHLRDQHRLRRLSRAVIGGQRLLFPLLHETTKKDLTEEHRR